MSTVAERFWSKVTTTGECWLWATATRAGYGAFWLDGGMRRAHRVAYELEVGPIPEGLDLDHLCRNKLCVRPSHLEPVTRAENTRRGRSLHLTGKCAAGLHDVTDESNRTVHKNGAWQCRLCRNARVREGAKRRKEATQ